MTPTAGPDRPLARTHRKLWVCLDYTSTGYTPASCSWVTWSHQWRLSLSVWGSGAQGELACSLLVQLCYYRTAASTRKGVLTPLRMCSKYFRERRRSPVYPNVLAPGTPGCCPRVRRCAQGAALPLWRGGP